jgi:hypothetical protein
LPAGDMQKKQRNDKQLRNFGTEISKEGGKI